MWNNKYTALLRDNADYRYLWLGYIVSLIGDWFNLIASAALISRLTDSGTQLSLLFLARFLPLFLFSPFAGLLADRIDRRRLMVVSDLIRAVIVLCLLLVRDESQIWFFYLLIASQFALSALFTPARSAALSNIVGEEDLITANTLDGASWSAMLAIGTLLGGLATAFFGITTAFVMDAGTFLLSAWLISRISTAATADDTAKPASGFQEIIGGFTYLWGAKLLLVIALAKGAMSLIYGAVNVLELEVAESVYPLVFEYGNGRIAGEGGTLTLTLIYLMTAFGTGIGPIVLEWWLGKEEPVLRWGVLVGIGLLAVGVFGQSFETNIWWFAAMSFVRALGTGTTWVFSSALLQILVPNDVRGRVFAFEFAILTLTQSVSVALVGWLRDVPQIGIFEILRWDGLLALCLVALWTWFYFASRQRPLISS